MIVNRFRHLQRTLDSSIGFLEKNPGAVKRLRRDREPLANQVLETEFGWRPLFADVHSALFTVCKDGVPPQYITSRAKRRIYVRNSVVTSDSKGFDEWAGSASLTYSARVLVTNPNLWMLNRLGLINPATVAWDLIPWSFVVNMFLNVNQMINSITDEIGLDVAEQTITRTSKLLLTTDRRGTTDKRGFAVSTRNIKTKSRTLGTPLKPHFEARLPELNWELCLIAGSLVVQKFQKINNIIRAI
jgi:hypothetical protein